MEMFSKAIRLLVRSNVPLDELHGLAQDFEAAKAEAAKAEAAKAEAAEAEEAKDSLDE